MKRVLVPLVITVIVAGCTRSPSEDRKGSDSGSAAPPPVVTVKKPIKVDSFTRTIEQPGQAVAPELTGLYAKIAGYVTAIPKDIGDSAKAGETLITVGLPELEKERDQKAAALEHARAVVVQAQRAQDVANARVDEADEARNQAKFSLERWEKEYARMTKLVGERVLDVQNKDETERQRDSAGAALKVMEARVRSARADVLKAVADVAAAAAHERLADADLQRVKILLEYREVKAPFDGVIVERHADTGYFATQQGTGSKNMPMLVIGKSGPARIFLDIPESDAIWVKMGDAAAVQFGGRELPGKVIRISGALKPKERALRTEIQLEDPSVKLPINSYLRTTVRVKHEETHILPAPAVVVEKELTFCYLVVEGKAVKIAVQTGLRVGADVELLRRQERKDNKVEWRAWTGDEKVIVSIPPNLKDGQEVQVLEK